MRNYELIKKSTHIWAEKRKFIIDYFPKNSRGCEIGVFYGQFSQFILDIAKPKMLYLVDPWLYDDNRTGENRTVEQMEEIFKEVCLKFKSYRNVSIQRMKSVEFFKNFKNFTNKLDFVYIDGCHDIECIYQDLIDSWKVIKPGGIIAGDDYMPNRHFGDNITRAVIQFCNEKQIEHQVFKIPGYSSQFLIIRS